MKRYYTFQTPPDPAKYSMAGAYHYMSLPGPTGAHDGGYICVLVEEGAEAPPDWVQLPHLLDATAADFNGVNTTPGAYVHALTTQAPAPLSLAGITPTDTMFQIAKKLATINRHFHP